MVLKKLILELDFDEEDENKTNSEIINLYLNGILIENIN